MIKKMALVICLLTIFCKLSADEKRPVRVYVDVVGDLFHSGHAEFFKKARALGDYLIVGVLADDIVEAYKRKPVLTMEERGRVIESCKFVDEVVLNCPLGINEEWIEKYHIDLVVHGDDYDEKMTREQYGPAIDRGIFKTVPYTPGISTSDIIERIIEQHTNNPFSLKKKDFYEGTKDGKLKEEIIKEG